MTASFDVPKGTLTAISKVADRYQKLLDRLELSRVDMLELHMDLTACHANGCPMDWEKLLSADDTTLAHDVGGIQRHISRKTGKLQDCFLPRCHSSEASGD
jgi:hypothetical protein